MENWKNKQVRRGSVDRTYTKRIELSISGTTMAISDA